MTTEKERLVESDSNRAPLNAARLNPGRLNNRAAAHSMGPGELIKEITADLSTLVRKEVELAKSEVGQVVKDKAMAAGLFALGGVLAIMIIPFALLTIVEVLAIWLPRWGASLIVTGLMMILAFVVFLFGKKKLRSKFKPEATIRTLKEDVQWAKNRRS